MIRLIKKFISKVDRYGECRECGLSLQFVNGKRIDYGPGEAFPICEDCFEDLSTDEICRHFDDLTATWVSNITAEQRRTFRRNVEAAKDDP